MKYLLLFYLLLYLYFIFNKLYRLWKIRNLINVIVNYLDSATLDSCFPNNLVKKENYQQCLNDVLFYYPVIAKYKTIFDHLEYGIPDEENYISAYHIYNDLMMQRNLFIHRFVESLNPIYTFKRMFKIPAAFIIWIGFKPSLMFSKLFNIFCWLLTFALNMYSEEIKLFISTLIHK